MKYILFTLVLLQISFSTLQAQQESHYTQFMYNKLLINPAYAGVRGVPTVTAIYRNQWMGFEGAPKSALVSFSSPFLSKRVGIGATIASRQIGLQNDFVTSLAYSYKLVSTEKVALRAGIMASLKSYGIRFDKANPLQIGDPSLDNQKANEIFGNLGMGLYGIFSGQFYAGLSVPHLYSNVIGINTDPVVRTAMESQHYYAMGGGIFPLSKDLNLMPAVLLKYVRNAPFDADINLNLEVKRKVTLGLSYRLGGDGAGESVDLLAYWQISQQFGLGAAYDLTLSGLKDYNSGSIELLAQFDLKKQKKNRMSNPRFFL